MKIIFKFILHIAANALAIFLAARFIEQIEFKGDWLDYLIVGAIFAVANLIIKPILKIISAPLIFITMGLFTLVINGLIIFGVDWFVDVLTIKTLMGYVWATLIFSIINAIAVRAYKKTREND